MTLKQHKLTDAIERIEAEIEFQAVKFDGAYATVRISDLRTILTTLAMHQASIPTEATGDDVEQAFKNGFVLGFDHRGRTDEPFEAVEGAIREWDHRKAIATLSPNRVSQSVVERAIEQLVIEGRAKKDSLNSEQREAADNEARAFYRKVFEHFRAALATQPATDTRIPINEEATDLFDDARQVLRWVHGQRFIKEHHRRSIPLNAIENVARKSIDRVSNDQG